MEPCLSTTPVQSALHNARKATTRIDHRRLRRAHNARKNAWLQTPRSDLLGVPRVLLYLHQVKAAQNVTYKDHGHILQGTDQRHEVLIASCFVWSI